MIKKKMQMIILVSTLILGIYCSNKDPVSGDPDPGDPGGDSAGTVRDADNNVYQTVKIGDQIWTVEDLRTTKFNDGSSIPQVKDSASWINLTSPAFCYYNNSANSDSVKKYGARYDWYAVNSNKLAPRGWHVPSISEWETLRDYLIKNGYNYDGGTSGNKVGKALCSKSDWKSSNTSGTIGNNPGANNKSDFNARPGGARYGTGMSGSRGEECHWWSSTETSYHTQAWSVYLHYDSTNISNHAHFKNDGFAVRLVKDK